MKFDYSTLIDSEKLTKQIARIAKVGKALQAEIHSVAVQTLGHIAAHGDTTLFIRLLNALPNGQRVKALAFWGNHFSGKQVTATFDKEAGAWNAKLVKGWSPEPFDMDGAVATSFADLTAEKGYSTLTMPAFLAMLKRTADKTGQNPDGTPKVEAKVRAICASLFAELSEKTKKPEEAPLPLAALLAQSE